MTVLKVCCIIALLIVASATATQASIPDFFNELFLEFESEYAASRALEYEAFCDRHNLDSMNVANRQTFFKIYFAHDLLTTVGSQDCLRGGILEIPYFWHWSEPNPRHSIRSLPDSTLLSNRKTSAPYEQYASFADIDRIPALFLGDLVKESPGYYHPGCGSFYSFGWCSEREMAYTALMIAWGYNVKIHQTGIHTYSVIWCEFGRRDGTTIVLAANVDNTFESITWQVLDKSTELKKWLRGTGSGTQIAWYNKMARSSEQIEALRKIPVSQAARDRIQKLVRAALSSGP